MASPARRVVRLLILAAAVIVVGLGGGYLAAGLAHHGTSRAPTAAGHEHGGHVMPDGTTMTDGTIMAPGTTTPAPTASGPAGMDGMDMSDGSDMGGMDMGGHSGHDGHTPAATTPTHRPRGLVLGTFGAVNGGVLVTAAFLRRRSPARRRTRADAR